MDTAEVFEKLTPIFRAVFNNESLVATPELTANDVDGWDSLTHMLLITEVEKAFSVSFRFKTLFQKYLA